MNKLIDNAAGFFPGYNEDNLKDAVTLGGAYDGDGASSTGL